MLYNHASGKVISSTTNTLLIKLDNGLTVRTKSDLDSVLNPDPPSWAIGTPVSVTWRGKEPRKFRGTHWVEPDAVEPKNVWHRTSSFVRLFTRDRTRPGIAAEDELYRALLSQGLKVEQSTGYEDERLGIDLWVFLYLKPEKRWRWIPIDITLRHDLDPYRDNSKYHTAFRKGVVAIHFEFDRKASSAAVTDLFIKRVDLAINDFTLCGKTLATRAKARALETQEFPA